MQVFAPMLTIYDTTHTCRHTYLCTQRHRHIDTHTQEHTQDGILEHCKNASLAYSAVARCKQLKGSQNLKCKQKCLSLLSLSLSLSVFHTLSLLLDFSISVLLCMPFFVLNATTSYFVLLVSLETAVRVFGLTWPSRYLDTGKPRRTTTPAVENASWSR